jgi:hypothetical protein
MARANVKISTSKIIDLLRKKASETSKKLAEIPALEKKHKSAVEAWDKKAIASVPKTAKPSRVDTQIVRYGEWEGFVKIEITHYVPLAKIGDYPERTAYSEYQLKNTLQELEQTIKLLELTDDDTVSASTYRNLAELL